MKINVITLFPDSFPGVLGVGLIGKALKNKKFELNIIDLKKYSINNRLDDRPFGGGPGMIIKADILDTCFRENNIQKILFVSPGGKTFNNKKAEQLSKEKNITFLCGRYEGIDRRLFSKYNIEEISIGDYILCGGEVATQVIIEASVRLKPGVLHNSDSTKFESFSSGLLEHNHYTRPVSWGGLNTPEVLLSGNHKEIQKFQWAESLENTAKNRPDLLENYLIKIFPPLMLVLIYKIYKRKL